jgi:CubicO group peptidase (beta-lactamase class C family)
MHDYTAIYGDRATKAGPMNHDPSGEYNYFSANFHPYYRHSDLHTMQSISKTLTSITIGVAMTRNDFRVGLDTPILKFFDGYKIAPDDRKKRITLRHLLTMTSGIEWHEDLAYDDPRNSSDVMEGKRDWAQYVLDQPMAREPGTSFVYSGGDTELLAYIFRKVTGSDIDAYADEYLFKPIGIQHFHWKHSPMGLPDTQGGLFLSTHDLAKIGMLILRDGVWNGARILSADWIRDSVSPHVSVGEGGRKYGYQWWLTPYGKSRDRLLWAAHGFGGQQLVIVPEYDALVVFTGWDILPSTEKHRHDALERALSALSADSALNAPPKP